MARQASAFSPLRLGASIVRALDVDRNLDKIAESTRAIIGEYRSNHAFGLANYPRTVANYAAARKVAGFAGLSILVAGRTTARDGGEGTFVWRTGSATDNDGTILAGPDGSNGYWERAGLESGIDPAWWGAVNDPGDASTDSASAIQRAIDYVLYYAPQRGRVRLRPGRYRTTKTVHLGYGDTLRSVSLYGAGSPYRGVSTFAGTTIFADFSDAPAIAIQGNYHGCVKGLSILGGNYNQTIGNGMASNGTTVDDTDPANWVDATLHANADSRYAPYVGIAIDPYRGAQPATHYPDVDYPPEDTAGGVQYDRAQSSGVTIEDVWIGGFVAGVVNQPNGDGNGDFTALRRVQIEGCKYGVSIGNTQCRNFSLDDCQIAQVYIALTNRAHGVQSGKYGADLRNLSVFGAINLVDFGEYYASPVTFSACYAESLWRLGSIETGVNDGAYSFEGCEFTFGLQTDDRGVPASVLTQGTTPTGVRFRDTTFSNYPSVLNFDGVPTFEGCYFRQDSRTNDYEKFAHNVLAGGCVTTQFTHRRVTYLKSKHYDLFSGSAGSLGRTDEWSSCQRNKCIPLGTQWVRTTELEDNELLLPPNRVRRFFGKSSLSACTLVDKTLTITFSSRSDATFYHYGPLPGDVLLDDETGSVFFVRSRTGTTVLAELQNNYIDDGAGGFDTVDAFSTSTGNFYIANSRYYCINRQLLGNAYVGSAVIADVSRGDGFAAFDAEISAGDYVYVEDTRDPWVSIANSLISARSQAAKTITLAGACASTETRRLAFFIRQPPANV